MARIRFNMVNVFSIGLPRKCHKIATVKKFFLVLVGLTLVDCWQMLSYHHIKNLPNAFENDTSQIKNGRHWEFFFVIVSE